MAPYKLFAFPVHTSLSGQTGGAYTTQNDLRYGTTRLAYGFYFWKVVRMIQRVFLDTETTGLGEADQIIEIGICDEAGNVLLDKKIRPTVPISPSAQMVHGISDGDLIDAPMWPEIESEVLELLEDKEVVIFNAKFDLRLLKQTMQAFDSKRISKIDELQRTCAMYRAGLIYGVRNQYGSISLANSLAKARIEPQGRPHSAIGDALSTAALWRKWGPPRERKESNKVIQISAWRGKGPER